jgi:hypothetical protein
MHMDAGALAVALQQFRRHVKYYQVLIGPKSVEYVLAATAVGRGELAHSSARCVALRRFEHWAWLSRQYELFGDLLANFPSLSSLSCNPAHYYQTSASYARVRVRASQRE